MRKPAKEVDLEAILEQIGAFGCYQTLTFLRVDVGIILSAVYNAQYIFTAQKTAYRCQVPECESPPLHFEPGQWASWALPPGADRCNRMQPIQASCSPASFHVNDTIACHAWVYENHKTIISEFDLACQEWKRTMVGTIHSVGLFFALPLTGFISDRYGRKVAFILTASSPAIIGLIRSFSVNYTMYLAFEFLDALLNSGVYSTGFILALEMVGMKKRVIGGNMMSCSFAIGQVLLALMAWAIPDWKTLTRVLYLPSVIFIFYHFVIEESVRWLLSNGNKAEAARIIFKAAKINKKKLSQESIKQLTEDNVAAEQNKEVPSCDPTKEKSLFMQVIKSKIIMSRLVICSFCWITVTFIYYGLSINSVTLAGNSYVNYILTSLVEIPGYCLSVLTLDRFGRRSSIMTAYMVCGISLFSLPFVPPELSWLQTSLNMLGKMAISMTFSSIYIYTSELFPTSARHRMLACCSMFGRVGSILAPQTPLLMTVLESLPYLMFGSMACISSLLLLLTPETLRVRLPDTVEEAEGIAAQPPRQTKVDVQLS